MDAGTHYPKNAPPPAGTSWSLLLAGSIEPGQPRLTWYLTPSTVKGTAQNLLSMRYEVEPNLASRLRI